MRQGPTHMFYLTELQKASDITSVMGTHVVTFMSHRVQTRKWFTHIKRCRLRLVVRPGNATPIWHYISDTQLWMCSWLGDTSPGFSC